MENDWAVVANSQEERQLEEGVVAKEVKLKSETMAKM